MRGPSVSSDRRFMYFISQLGESDCGFTCLKMILAHLHKDRNYLYLPGEANKEYSFKDLQDIAEKYHVEAHGVRPANFQEVAKAKKSWPLLTNIKLKKGQRHSVIIKKVTKNKVHYFDPALGHKAVPIEVFTEQWTGHVILVEKFTRTKCPYKFPSYISKQDKVLLPILQTLSGVSLLAGTFFLTESYPLYIPIIFLASFLIFEVIYRASLVSAMKRMDQIVYSKKFSSSKTPYPEIYQTIQKYRRISLSILPNFIYFTLVSVFIVVVLLSNDLRNLIYIVIPLLFAFVEAFFYSPHFDEVNTKIVEVENEIQDVKTDFHFKTKADEAHELAYNLALGRNALTYVEIGLVLIISLLTMNIKGLVDITYVIFFVCVSVFLKSNFTKLFSYSKEMEEYDFLKAKLINSIDEEIIDENNNSIE